jgi:hypothetical protein
VHVSGDEEREAARRVTQLLETAQWVVPGIQRVGTRSPKVSQLRYFKQTEQPEAEQIATVLKKGGYEVSLAYIAGYEDSKAIRPMHFELWFAARRTQTSILILYDITTHWSGRPTAQRFFAAVAWCLWAAAHRER